MNKTAAQVAQEKAAAFVSSNGDNQDFTLQPLQVVDGELYKANIIIKGAKYATVTVDKAGNAKVEH